MVYVGDPVASGLVTSLARPEANLTGFSMNAPEMVRKGLELLKEAVPSVSRVAALIDSSNPGQTLADERMTTTATALGIRLQQVELRTSADLDAALGTVLKLRADALFVHPLPITARDSERLAAFAVKHRLPTMATFQASGKTGLLMSYVTDVAKQFRRVGFYIDRILRGANPTDLPIEPADASELWINLKTAKALNLTIPLSLLLRADRWIE
jgi:putative ABC transport system substrate-binding protein